MALRRAPADAAARAGGRGPGRPGLAVAVADKAVAGATGSAPPAPPVTAAALFAPGVCRALWNRAGVPPRPRRLMRCCRRAARLRCGPWGARPPSRPGATPSRSCCR
ncbi:hypothetical protein GCM10018793_62860 [Streptomyces sulfonofaciens]|uniref:Uncharacterized protein n=1 Tax=Streptomyces sulfonofaciens TaxID=68272 RepID=A0A919L967_9ACTN|nr:hypothetical protein GCM10018793_62860 [Streptomyces sulfonofaciens]